MTQLYGFQTEILQNYGHMGLWQKFMDVFDCLPIAALTDDDIMSVHGGLSPRLLEPQTFLTIKRQREIPEKGLLADVTWSSPDERTKGWRPSPRGAGFLFGPEPTHKFCWLNGIRLITRSHQLVQVGFQWFFGNKEEPPCLINVWSAPNYAGSSGNIASVLRLRFNGKEEFNLPTFDEASDRITDLGVLADPNAYFA
jgi:diadenosine tetraphosphatase ApaH/serine/threonine PP2A family protein phosphatase